MLGVGVAVVVTPAVGFAVGLVAPAVGLTVGVGAFLRLPTIMMISSVSSESKSEVETV